MIKMIIAFVFRATMMDIRRTGISVVVVKVKELVLELDAALMAKIDNVAVITICVDENSAEIDYLPILPLNLQMFDVECVLEI